MLIGTIVFIDLGKGFGKLKLDDGNEYTFLKRNLLDSKLWDELSNGVKVRFELDISSNKKKYANNISVFLDSEVCDNEIVNNKNDYLLPEAKINDSELIIGIVSSVGTPSNRIIIPLKDRLEGFGYSVDEIRVSQFLPSPNQVNNREDERIFHFMEQGDIFREKSNNNSILAIASVVRIKELRSKKETKKKAYIINSLKHPDEVELLRKIYGDGFYLFGIHSDKPSRKEYLEKDKHCNPSKADELIRIDENEDKKYGQKTRDTYHLSDFFLNLSDNEKQVKNTIQRFLELIFSDPYKTPTFDEYAMFMAFNSSVRSADLSRQVGAVISRNHQILSTGANDVPRFGGGLYWAEKDSNGEVKDLALGRDYTRNVDQNKQIQRNIIQNIVKNVKAENLLEEDKLETLESILKESEISDLTEFGRVVHAEMEAILACSREGVSTKESILYCTTFPCHNCAKHIIASGIIRVVYVEPYPKSKALEFHNDSIELQTNLDDKKSTDKVIFEPFIGVGPRRFLDLFSMSLGSGTKLRRKDKDGSIIKTDDKNIRTPLLNKSYIELENDAENMWKSFQTIVLRS